MTCRDALAILDAAPAGDYPPVEIEAARVHARQCAACGPALQASQALTDGLPVLPQVSPPSNLAAGVLARIARLDERDTRAVPGPRPVVAAAWRVWPAWATATGGLAAGVGLVMRTYGGVPEVAAAAAAAAGNAMGGLLSVAPQVWGIVVCAGLALYTAGVLAPTRKPKMR